MGCSIGMGSDWESSGPACGWFCIDFALVAHAGQSFLKGDTLNVDVISTTNLNYATWSVSGPTLALVDGDSLARSVSRPTGQIRVVALSTGDAAVYAQAAGSSLKDTIQLRVMDSSRVTKVEIASYPTPTIKVGEDWYIAIQLSDTVSLIAGTPRTCRSVTPRCSVDHPLDYPGFRVGGSICADWRPGRRRSP